MNAGKSFDRLVERYYATYGANEEYNYFLEEFVDTLKRGKVLDLGCGAGMPVAKTLVGHGFDVVGVDISKKMKAAAVKMSQKPRLFTKI
jgi:SAM-dependent methyltransferase